MVIKRLERLIIVLCLFAGLVLSSCDDNLSKVGTTIQPPEDFITVYTDTFFMEASTVRLDSVFAKTSDYLLGEMYDPVYGNMKADLLCQFYCEEGFQFTNTPCDGLIDSVNLVIGYSYDAYNSLVAYGDTMAPMQVSVYPVNRPLQRNFYTNDNPENYCDMENPLGAKSYTIYDMGIPDSLRYRTYYVNNAEYLLYPPNVSVTLPTELGQKIYDETINNPSTFETQSAFNEFFPGVYITNTFGSGCFIRTNSSSLYLMIYYKYTDKASDGVTDTIINTRQSFTVPKEVVQINRFENNNLDALLEKNPNNTYIKSPAGVCTKLVIPTIDISNKLDISDRYINGFNLSLKYLPEDERDYVYSPPSHLLLLPEDSVKSFFENGSVENNITSYVSFGYDATLNYPVTNPSSTQYGYNHNTRTYTFGNISALLKTHIENSPDKDLNLLVMPVVRSVTEPSSRYFYTIGISNSFNLSGVKIRTDEDLMKVIVLSSKFENK